MSETQPPTTSTNLTPSVSQDDLRLLYDAEKLKRENAEKKVGELEAALAESKAYGETTAASLNGHLKEARVKLSQAEERASVAEKKLEETGERLKKATNQAYLVYLAAWSELKIGKLTLPKGTQGDPSELAAVAIAGFDHGRGHLSSRKDFETQLTAKLGV